MFGVDTSAVVYSPEIGAYNRVGLTELPDDPDSQVEITVSLMQQYASEDSITPQVINDARESLSEQYAVTRPDPVDAMWDYVKSRMTFVRDAVTGAPITTIVPTNLPVIEVLIRPRDMHVWQRGDCDDFSTYGAALLTALRVPVSFVTVAADDAEPSIYSHVYLVAYPTTGKYAGMRVPLDLSHGDYVGWEVANKYGKRREWPVTSPGQTDSLGGLLALVAVGCLLVKGKSTA